MTIKKSSTIRKLIKKLAYQNAFLFGYATDTTKFHFSPRFIPRGITIPFRMKPNFIIVGAAKSGTTSLYNYLTQHPQVVPALKKEINYWNGYKPFGLKWYRGNFPIISNKKITGEASINYLKFPHIAEKIFKDFPKVKIIILLRNPVDRIFSDYNYQKNFNKRESLTFEEALTFEEFRFKAPFHYRINSIYIEQIKPYFEVFPKDQIKILDFDELVISPQFVMDEVCKFLKIPKKNDWKFKIYNKLEYDQKINPSTKSWLSDFFKPYNEQLFKFLGKRFNWD